MGKMIYCDATFHVPDDVLFALDAVIAAAHTEGLSFQLHLPLGGEADHNIASITLGPGNSAIIEFLNYAHEIDYSTVMIAVESIRRTGMLSIGDLSSK